MALVEHRRLCQRKTLVSYANFAKSPHVLVIPKKSRNWRPKTENNIEPVKAHLLHWYFFLIIFRIWIFVITIMGVYHHSQSQTFHSTDFISCGGWICARVMIRLDRTVLRLCDCGWKSMNLLFTESDSYSGRVPIITNALVSKTASIQR